MAKKKEKLRKRSADWEPSQRDLDIILNRLNETGQEYILQKEPEAYEKVCEEYMKFYPDDSIKSLNYKYFTLLNYLRYVFRKYRLEFFMWISEPKWVFEADRVLENFLNTGYVPDKYRAAEDQNGFFKWVPDAQIELVMMPRGTGKTTKWICMRALWEVIRHPTYKWLVVHSDKDRAKSLLTSIKEMMMSPYLGLVFPDLFTEDPSLFKKRSGNLLTREKINVVTYNEETEELDSDGFSNSEFRKEATFTVGSPQIDRTSWHFEGVFADDLVTNITSKSPKDTEQLSSYFTSLFAMQQYREDWKFRCFMTGTEWWENSLYTRIKETYENATVFEIPAEWEDSGDTVKACPRFLTEEILDGMRITQKKWFESQMYMKPRPFEGGELNVGFSIDRNVIELTLDDVEELKRENLIGQICDPSFTTKNKKEGDKKSRFSIINATVDETRYMVYNAWQTFGMDTGGIKDVNRNLAKTENIDMFVQDAQGQGQTGLYDEQIRYMKDDMPYLMDYKHTQSLGRKEEVANKVLSLLFEMREIYIVKIKDDPDPERRKFIDRLINQLLGIGGMDFVDCLVMMVADIDRNQDVAIARALKKAKARKKKRGIQKISLRQPSQFGRLA